MTMKKDIKGIVYKHPISYLQHTTLEGKNSSGKTCGKVSMDYKPCKYCTIKKVSLENNGVAVADLDFTNLVKNTTFMIRQKSYIIIILVLSKMSPSSLLRSLLLDSSACMTITLPI